MAKLGRLRLLVHVQNEGYLQGSAIRDVRGSHVAIKTALDVVFPTPVVEEICTSGQVSRSSGLIKPETKPYSSLLHDGDTSHRSEDVTCRADCTTGLARQSTRITEVVMDKRVSIKDDHGDRQSPRRADFSQCRYE